MVSKKMMGLMALVLVFCVSCDLDQLLGGKKAEEKPGAEKTGQTPAGDKKTSPDKEAGAKPAEGKPAGAKPAEASLPSGDLPAAFSITYGGGKNTLAVKKESPEKWTATAEGKTLTLAVAPGNEFTCLDGTEAVASGKLQGGELKLLTKDNKFFLRIKFKEEKIKVFLSDDKAAIPWDFKYKEGKVKVVIGETELGKVKYDAEKGGKLKVKDVAENVVAESRDLNRLTAVPAPFLVQQLDPHQRAFLVLILSALNK